MSRTMLGAFALLLVVFEVSPAPADTPVALLPAAPGAAQHYRIVHTTQTAHGPTTTTSAFDIVRRSEKTLVIERPNPDGTPNVSVLTQAHDGSLALAEDPRGAAADADLTDVLYGINLAIAATSGIDATAKTPWNVAIPLAPAAGAPTVAVTVVPLGSAAGDVDFSGSGDGYANPAPARRPNADVGAGAGRGGFGGGFPGGGGSGGGGFPGGGGGFPGGGVGGVGGPGGGFPGRGRSADSDQDGPGGGPPGGGQRGGTMPVSVRIDGHAAAGRITRVAVTETRSVMVAGLPYVNVGSWAISVGK